MRQSDGFSHAAAAADAKRPEKSYLGRLGESLTDLRRKIFGR
jgi:hypothetical protein